MIWTGANYEQLREWCPLVKKSEDFDTSKDLIIVTLEDKGEGATQVPHVLSLLDVLALGPFGEFYPIKPWVFSKTYEEVMQHGPLLNSLIESINDAGDVTIEREGEIMKLSAEGYNSERYRIYRMDDK